MADPIVHITNGIPDAGTGTITTLGQTLLDGANIALGATTDLTVAAGAAGTINTHLRTISRDIAGGIVLQAGGNVIGAVTQSGGPWSVSGSVSITGSVTVTGTVAATQSGAWNIGNVTGTVSLPTGAATSAKQPALGVAGTASTDVITVQGIAAMTPLKVDGSGVTQPISGNVGISGNVNCVQVTSPWVTSVSGNVTIVQGGNLTTRMVGNTGNTVDFASTQNVASPQAAVLIGAQFNTVPTTLTSTNSSPLQMDSAANLLVNVKSSVLPTGAATSANQPTAAALGSTTSGQTGHLALGAVTTAAPSYTTAQSNALSLTTVGNLRVDGSSVTQPVSGTVTVTQGTAANLNATVTGTVAATQSGTWTVQPGNTANTTPWLVTARNVGNTGAVLDFAGQNAASPANAILIGGQFNTTPTTLTSGNSSPLQLDSAGNLKVSTPANVIAGPTWNNATALNTTVTIPNNPSILGQVTVGTTITAGALTFEESYDNGTTWLAVPSGRLINPSTGAQIANPYTLVASTNLQFQIVSTGTTQMRVRLSTAITGTGSAAFLFTSSPLINEVQVFQNNAANLKVDLSGTAANATAIKVDGSAVTQPVLNVLTAANNNLTYSRVNAAASTNATSLKASAGNIAAIDVFNVAAYMVFLKLYNKASAPTVGTDTPVWTIPLPANGAFSGDFTAGEYFSTGIAYAITKLQADADTTAVAAGDVTGRIKWI